MSETVSLESFLPPNSEETPVSVVSELASVLHNIATVFPHDKLFEFFQSSEGSMGGIVMFPYCRVDAHLSNCDARVTMARHAAATGHLDWYVKDYQVASESALEAILWVEVGFGGIDGFAANEVATRSWTAGGHGFTGKEKAHHIKTKGKDWYEQTIEKFAHLRRGYNQSGDIFARYGLESLLNRWKD